MFHFHVVKTKRIQTALILAISYELRIFMVYTGRYLVQPAYFAFGTITTYSKSLNFRGFLISQGPKTSYRVLNFGFRHRVLNFVNSQYSKNFAPF